MNTRHFRIAFFVLAVMLSSTFHVFAQDNKDERQIEVGIRMIGHKILLSSGDSVSRVLPIEKEGDRYKLQFESDFQFDPEDLVALIENVVRETRMAVSYLVEVEECETQKVVYSYMIGNSAKSDVVPCKHRVQPKACYALLFTILNADNQQLPAPSPTIHSELSNELSNGGERVNIVTVVSLGVAPLMLIVLLGLFLYFRKKMSPFNINPNILSIGAFQFDKRNMTLSFENEITELTSKESDLLLLLYSSANKTIERETILNAVWRNESDYVGRTVDVFISKLRKKLEADANLKIVNIRGVGYKLIMNK